MLKKLLLFYLCLLCLTTLSGQQKVAPVKSVPPSSKKVKAPVKTVKPPAKTAKAPVKPVKAQLKAAVVAPKGISAERSLRLVQRIEAQKSIVLLQNHSSFLPLGRLDTLKILVVSAGLGAETTIGRMINRYVMADQVTIDPGDKTGSIRRKINPKNYNLVVLAIGDQLSGANSEEENLSGADELSGSAGPESLTEDENKILGIFPGEIKIICLVFGSSKLINRWSASERSSAVVVSGKADYDRMDLSTQLLFGAFSSIGKLPFDLAKYKSGDGLVVSTIGRLSYVIPEEVGIDSLKLSKKMDSLVRIGLKAKAYPGCQMLLAKNGKVFYHRSYGYHTYEEKLPVQNDDIYDLASVTKILAPVPALMMLADQKKFLVTRKMSDYWTTWKGSNKEGILASDVLSHQARLRPGLILWPKTIDERGMYRSDYIASQAVSGFDLRLSERLYLKNSFPDTVLKAIDDSPLLRTKKYVYSDLGFVLFPRLIENLSGESYQSFLKTHLYSRLGASTLMYNPWKGTPKVKIVPTEDDRAFRRELLHGYVHDETAALMGGVSGNAGLFGSSNDVAKIMQLYLQEGIYGNERYISAETLKNWTSSHPQKVSNRRGYGFDKPAIRASSQKVKERYPSGKVSEQSFGHSGYTGTFTWADPSNKLLFVFLSNRVFPDRDNQKINKLKLRTLLLDNLFKLADEPLKTR